MASSDSDIDALWRLVDAAVLIESEPMRRTEVESIESRALEAAGSDASADLWFLLGYVLYSHPDRRSNVPIAQNMVTYLRCSLILGRSVSLSHLYLAYHYFDMRQLQSALCHFRDVCDDDLDENTRIRFKEIFLSCSITANGILSSRQQLIDYALFIQGLSSPDIPPIILADALEEDIATHQYTEMERSQILDLLKMLDRVYPILPNDWFERMLP